MIEIIPAWHQDPQVKKKTHKSGITATVTAEKDKLEDLRSEDCT